MWDQVIGGLVLVLIVGLAKHVLEDVRTRQRVETLEKRVGKLDGINGK